MDDFAAEETEEPVGILMETEDADAPEDEFDMAADAFMNEALPIKERRIALKNAIMACMGTDYSAEEEPAEESLSDSTFGALFSKK